MQVYECHECAEIFESRKEAVDHLLREHFKEVLDSWSEGQLEKILLGERDVSKFFKDGKCEFCSSEIPEDGRADHLVDEHLTELLDVFEKEIKEGKFNENEMIETFFDVYDVDEE